MAEMWLLKPVDLVIASRIPPTKCLIECLMPFSSSNRSDISAFLAMDVLRNANRAEAAGQSVIHMEVGQPAAPAPAMVLKEAALWLARGRLGYTDALGLKPLRERIAQHYQDAYGVQIDPERVVVTTGSSAGFILAFLAAFDVGDAVGLPSPGYPAYRNILKALGLRVIEIETRAEDRWTLSVENLRRAHEAHTLKGVLVASPANPSGTMLTPPALRDIATCCEDWGIRFISDEIYHGLVFSGEARTAAAHSDSAIIINSFSKYYCMTGWRIGWMILPPELLRPVERLAQNLFISAPELSQRAARVAFDAKAELEEIKKGYARNRDILLARLPAMGLTDFLPVDGAFYVYVNCRDFTNDTQAFTARMLTETGIAATPGADFDPQNGHTYIRLSFAGAEADMIEAMDRLAPWLHRQCV